MNANASPHQLKRFIPFEDMPDCLLEELGDVFRLESCGAGEMLFERQSPVTQARFLLSGQVSLCRQEYDCMQLDGDAYENCMALDASHACHRYSARTITDCRFVVVERRYLELMATWLDIARSQSVGLGQGEWLIRLLACKAFERIPAANIQLLVRRFEEQRVNPGDVIIHENDPGDAFYLIRQGSAVVTRKGLSQPLATLQAGDMFGEEALISDLPRNATVTIAEDTRLMALPKADFIALLSAPVLQYVDHIQLERLVRQESRPVVLMDVRQPREVACEPLLPAKNIPLSELRQRLPGLSRDCCYVVQGLGRGEAAAYVMSEAGYKVRVLVKALPGA